MHVVKSLSVFLLYSFLFIVTSLSFADADEKKDKVAPKKPEAPSFDSYIEGMDEIKGFLTLYQKEQKLYALVSNSQMKKPFLLAMTISGGMYAGMQWDEMMVYWEKQDKKLLLVRPDLRHKAERTTMENVVERTFPSSIIRALPIIAEGNGGILIDMGEFLKSDLAGVSRFAGMFLGGYFSYNWELSTWSKIKAFPNNMEIGLDMVYTGAKLDEPVNWTDSTDGGRSEKLGVHYSIADLPRTDYKPRAADNRVGFFNTAIKDFSKKYEDRTKFDRYIHRWNLQKIDPSLDMSPAKNPIVFYIENSVPYRYRRFVREGIAEWNKAFEKIGFVDAIIVRQQTDTDFADLDPEDARYNFFRWTTNEMGFAAGPSRVNPMTGEILDADIIFDDSMLRFASQEYVLKTPVTMLAEMDSKLEEKLRLLPQNSPFAVLKMDKKEQDRVESVHNMMRLMEKRGHNLCMCGYGKKHQLAMAKFVKQDALKGRLSEEFVGQYIKEIVMHEVGHTLGLYHNFKASSWLSLDKINSPEKPAATAGSVMDYNPINFAPKGSVQGNYVTTTIGPYDYWAIEYGYKISDDEAKMLQEVAKRCTEDGLAYGNDLYASFFDPDPHIMRWDFSADNVSYAEQQIKIIQDTLNNLVQQTVAEGEDFFPVRRAFNVLMSQYAYSCLLVNRYISGQHLHWDHKGDPNQRAPFVVVSAEKQRQALSFLVKNVFAENVFNFPPELLNHLAPGTWWHWGTDELTMANNQAHGRVMFLHAITLFLLLDYDNLNRLYDSQLQVPADKEVFTLSELFTELTKAIWSELDKNVAEKLTERRPLINSYRRNLQRMYLQVWEFLILSKFNSVYPPDAVTLAWKNFNDLQAGIDNMLKKQELLDTTSLAHLLQSKTRIQETLKAVVVK